MNDVRTVLHPRSQVQRIERRLIEAANRARGLTLSLREASTLVTFIAAAKRLAGGAVSTEAPSVYLELQKTIDALAAAERRIWQLEKGERSVPDREPKRQPIGEESRDVR